MAMQCLRCTNEALPGKALCETCFGQGRGGSQAEPTGQESSEALMSTQAVDVTDFHPAGFWFRVLANLIDSSILWILNLVLTFIWGLVLGISLSEMVLHSNKLEALSLNTSLLLFLPVLVGVFAWILSIALIGLFYYSLFESSKFRATPGKMLFGITVTDLYGEQITLQRALFRNISRWAWMVPILFGVSVVILLRRPFGETILWASFVVSAVLSLVAYPLAGVTLNKQALHDLIAQTLVVRDITIRTERLIACGVFAVILAIVVGSCSGEGRHRSKTIQYKPYPATIR